MKIEISYEEMQMIHKIIVVPKIDVIELTTILYDTFTTLDIPKEQELNLKAKLLEIRRILKEVE